MEQEEKLREAAAAVNIAFEAKEAGKRTAVIDLDTKEHFATVLSRNSYLKKTEAGGAQAIFEDGAPSFFEVPAGIDLFPDNQFLDRLNIAAGKTVEYGIGEKRLFSNRYMLRSKSQRELSEWLEMTFSDEILAKFGSRTAVTDSLAESLPVGQCLRTDKEPARSGWISGIRY